MRGAQVNVTVSPAATASGAAAPAGRSTVMVGARANDMALVGQAGKSGRLTNTTSV